MTWNMCGKQASNGPGSQRHHRREAMAPGNKKATREPQGPRTWNPQTPTGDQKECQEQPRRNPRSHKKAEQEAQKEPRSRRDTGAQESHTSATGATGKEPTRLIEDQKACQEQPRRNPRSHKQAEREAQKESTTTRDPRDHLDKSEATKATAPKTCDS